MVTLVLTTSVLPQYATTFLAFRQIHAAIMRSAWALITAFDAVITANAADSFTIGDEIFFTGIIQDITERKPRRRFKTS